MHANAASHRFLRHVFAVLLLSLAANYSISAQNITGNISGTVTDANGAAIPGATVKVTHVATQQTRNVMSDPNGFYVATNLPIGNYTVSVEHTGFKKTNKSGYNLVADGRLTVDIVLEAGAVSETVEIVASSGETVNSTNGEIARVIDQAQVQELALNGRNYLQLTTLIPGAPLLTDDPLALMTDLGVNQPINGNRGNTNLLTVDGGFNLDSGSNNSQINNVGIDFIQEVSVRTSNFSADVGRNAGASINVATRSGGNKYHGSAFEFLRNDKLDANNFFNKARTPEIAKPSLRFNDFGWSFGGPIKKDKFFFFAGQEWKKIRRFTASTGRSIPTRAERLGDFSARSNVFLKDPSKTGTCSATVQTACFPNPKMLPANLISPDGKAIAAVFAAMEKRAVFYVDTPTANNAVYQEPNPFNVRQDILRLDYRINERHSLYGRYLHDDYVLIAPFGTFIDSQLPTIPTLRNRPSPSYQIGYTWMIKPNLINEAKANASWNGQRIPPVGELWKRETYGFAYQQLFANGGRYENSIPNVNVNGFATFAGASASLLSPTTDIAFSDYLSWIRGAHTIKTGVQIIRNRKDQNGRSLYAGNVTFNSSGNPNSTGNAFADALLGNFNTYQEFSIDPIGFFRFSQVESFVNDSWRVNRKLTLDLGVRYAHSSPTYTQANNIVNFDPALYNPSKAVTVITVNQAAVIDTSKGGNRYNGLVIAGNGVPQDELGRVPNGRDPLVTAVPTGAPRGLFEAQHVFMPRVGFAFSPHANNKMAIRGGFGIFYDKPEGNIIFSSVNIPPFTDSASFQNGNLSNIRGGAAAAVAPFADINTIDPNLVLPYTMSYSLSVQRDLPWGVFGEVAYVGNQGRHLLRQPDINQAPFDALRANAALPSAQRAATNALRPYKGYAAIRHRLSDSNSNYNSLQVYATKRKGDLTMTVSYTFSKALADTSGNGDNPEDPFNRSYNYGPTSFDRRHIFVTTYTYRLPFFRKSNGLLKNTLGGWEVSGITRKQSGGYLTPSGTSSIGSRRADATGQPVEGPQTLAEWFNKAAFTRPPDDRRGTAGVGVIEGPGRHLWDLSLRKRFTITERFKLQFQGDFFNAWNQVNLNNPNTDSNSTSYATINGAAPGRNIQLGLKLNF